jgi:nicotinamidase-related amidase
MPEKTICRLACIAEECKKGWGLAPDFKEASVSGSRRQSAAWTGKECSIMSLALPVPPYPIHDAVTIDPAHTALIVVDMQNDFVREGGTLRVPDAEATIPAIQHLVALAREHAMRIVFTQDSHTEGDPEWRIWPEHARVGTWGWQIIDALQPQPHDTVLPKLRYDAFYGTPLDHLLRLWQIDTLVLCGTVASICVHYTAASAALRWYRVIIPKDAISALDPFDLEASLRQTAFLFAGTIAQSEGIQVL